MYACSARLLLQEVPTQEPDETARIIHYLEHILIDLDDAMKHGAAALNPLAYSCSQAEDFIGRACLLSRLVGAVTNDRRVLQRWLAGAMSKWKAGDASMTSQDRIIHHQQLRRAAKQSQPLKASNVPRE